MNVSIIVPVYRDSMRLLTCITSILANDLENTEFIIVDNHPEPVVKIPASMHGQPVCVIHEPAPGSYAARNTGIKHSRGEIVGFTDSDCIVAADWICNAKTAFEALPDIGFIGGEVRMFAGNRGRQNAIEKHELYFSLNQERLMKYAGFAATANLWVRRHVLAEAGLFNDRVISGGDKEWCHRAVAAGFKGTYAANVLVHHPVRNNYRDFARKTRRVGAGFCEISNHSSRLQSLRELLMIGRHHYRRMISDPEVIPGDKLRLFFVIILERCFALSGFCGRLVCNNQYR